MVERLLFHDLHAAAGATFDSPCAIELPMQYGDAPAEYLAVRRGAGLIDRSHHGVVEVTGRDRASFLHAILSNEIKALAPGQGCAATLLDIHGKVQLIVAVWILEERILVVTPPGVAARTVEELDRFLFSEKAVLREASGELAMFVVAGPDAPKAVESATGIRLPEAPWSHTAAGDIRVVRGAGETGEAEGWVVAPAAEGPAVWQRLIAADARPVGLIAQESLRIETGTPLLGHDVDATVLLPEIPNASLLSHTKGCYPGQEVVVRIRDRGHVNRFFVGLVLDGTTVPAPGDAIAAGGNVVGHVTSATRSLGLDRPIALGFLRREHATPGTSVTISTGHASLPATVSGLPFSR